MIEEEEELLPVTEEAADDGLGERGMECGVREGEGGLRRRR